MTDEDRPICGVSDVVAAEAARERLRSSDLDAIAAGYYADPPADEWIEDRVVRWIMPKIIGWCSGRVLEMGYGAGRTSAMLREADIDPFVMEGAPILAKDAVEAGFDVIQTMFEDFDLALWQEEPFDTVLCLHVLEHVENPRALVRRIRTWLKPEGRLVVVTPNSRSVHRKVGALLTGDMIDTLSERDRLVGHRRVYDGAGLIDDVLTDGRFELEDVFGWFLKPVNNARMVDWPPELIDALCEIGWDSPPYDCANIGLVARAI